MVREKSEILGLLIQESSLTPKQASSLMTYRTGDHLKTLNAQTRILQAKPTRKGVYYRILDQARRNATRSLFTVILLHHLDIIDDAAWDRISDLSIFLKSSTGTGEIDQEAAARIVREMESAFRKILSMKSVSQ